MRPRTKYLLLAGIMIIATFLRFYHFTATPGLYPDEAIEGNNAAEVAQAGNFQPFYAEDNGREGLYSNSIAVLFRYFDAPHEPWIVRLPAAIAGVLTVLGIYFLGAELMGDAAGLLAAFLLAASFWHIDLSRLGFRAILGPLFLVWALYFFIRSVQSEGDGRARAGGGERNAESRNALWLAAIAGAIYGLGFYSYIAYRITPLIFLLFIPFFVRRHGFYKRALVFIAITFIVAAPLGFYFLQHPAYFSERTAEISVINSANPLASFSVNAAKELLMFNWRGDGNWRQNVSGTPELFWPVGLLLLIGIAIGIYSLWKFRRGGSKGKQAPEANQDILNAAASTSTAARSNSRFAFALVFIWFIAGLIPAALSNESIPHALRSILALPPAILLSAAGGIWLYSSLKSHFRNHVPALRCITWLAIIFIVSVAVFAYFDYFVIWMDNPNVPGAFNANYVAVGRGINSLPSAAPKYVIIEAPGVITRGFPMSAETTMFITDTFTPAGQAAKNVHYILPDEAKEIPENTPPGEIFYIE